MITSWLIEWPATRQEPVRYWHPTEGHVIDPNHAVRFCRQEDAEAMLKRDGLHAGAKAVEHRWLHPSPEMGEIALGEPCTLESCPPGLFLAAAYGTLGMKSEYHTDKGAVEAYIVESGEFFWGDNPQTVERQRAQIVRPIAHDAILSKLKENGLSREELGGLARSQGGSNV